MIASKISNHNQTAVTDSWIFVILSMMACWLVLLCPTMVTEGGRLGTFKLCPWLVQLVFKGSVTATMRPLGLYQELTIRAKGKRKREGRI